MARKTRPKFMPESDNILDPFRMKLAKSEIMVSLSGGHILEIVKSRYGKNGEINIPEAIVIFADMISKNIFRHNLIMFREGLKELLIEAMTDVIYKEGGDKLDTL